MIESNKGQNNTLTCCSGAHKETGNSKNKTRKTKEKKDKKERNKKEKHPSSRRKVGGNRIASHRIAIQDPIQSRFQSQSPTHQIDSQSSSVRGKTPTRGVGERLQENE
ncbi:hypothetical protein T440DRAFT_479841 [Plenodomus tracheiphilus IPT5]|uniref:Uncharacterized protein n=1 Tax=Plenodomus tracheiphilus IPT5 TaxID=1408161 RepID=A0A6A7B3A1_9PLEO|nr:hypothetical protein T440DRAFT_479841 [Plenodomus tracheiphilus IPT5]